MTSENLCCIFAVGFNPVRFFSVNVFKSKMKKIILLVSSLLLGFTVSAQEALWSGAHNVISPQVDSLGNATFRFVSPSAKEVYVMGDFLAEPAKMTKKNLGVWEYTTGPLSPELYLYKFMVDSVATLDPLNIYINRDITSITNRLLVPGVESAPYDENMSISHGTVCKIWYNSPSLGFNRRLSVYTPSGYEKADKNYPVLYLLHGMGGDENACELPCQLRRNLH